MSNLEIFGVIGTVILCCAVLLAVLRGIGWLMGWDDDPWL